MPAAYLTEINSFYDLYQILLALSELSTRFTQHLIGFLKLPEKFHLNHSRIISVMDKKDVHYLSITDSSVLKRQYPAE